MNGGFPTAETFGGNNTYTGKTKLQGGKLFVNGSTSGQGDFLIGLNGSGGQLGGMGTIGLASLATLSVGQNARIAPGLDSAIGNLGVSSQGGGGVVFGDASFLNVQVASNGTSDLLAIAAGFIDLRSTTDTLELSALAGGFDGSAYTIATFDQNLGGIFDAVTGLPSSYFVAYGSDRILLLPVPEPGTSVSGLAGLGLLLGLGRSRRHSGSFSRR